MTMILTNPLIKTLNCLNLIMILVASQTLAFMPALTKPKTHYDITRDAILQTTADVCRSQAFLKGQNFIRPATLTVYSVAESCSSSCSALLLRWSIYEIGASNAWVDFRHFFDARYHFTDEKFLSGRDLITKGVYDVKYSIKWQSYRYARQALGKILHTLQDFYSHSNWIEMGNRVPYSNLIKPYMPITNIADSATCRRCRTKDCRRNILEEVNARRKLTSAYFGFTKPKGKCSHGGFFDPSSWWEGGINKDATDSSHGYLHETAASVATAASRDLLQDIRATVGDSEFLRLMGLQTSVLSFVIDTTSSMLVDIIEIIEMASNIIANIRSVAQTAEYILVPFNDPAYGPLIRTTDPNVFQQHLSGLTAHGGGDIPEMCLSALQLALTGSPPRSEIFLFTDATAKDIWLKNAVQGLIEMTKSRVNFMLTNARRSGRRRRDAGPVGGHQQPNQLYHDLAQASGGQAIEVTKGTLNQATEIIALTSKSTLVTLFQAVRNPAKAESFSVFVDSSVQNLTIFITGNSPTYTITSPTGVSQSSADLDGSLGNIKKVGNFHTMQPKILDQTGLWVFSISSTQPYTIKVVGQSEVDFLFDFVELSQGIHPSFAVLNSRPAANNNVTLLVTMAGGDSVRPTVVSLVKASSSYSLNGTPEEAGSGQYLVTFNSLPAGDFTVRVVGQTSSSKSSNNTFQRQSATQTQASTVTITMQFFETLEPGKQFTLPFTVATNGSGGSFNISVSNDRNFDTRFNTSITLESGGSANGTVTLTVPKSTSSGTDVTLTIQAEAADGSDFNYAVLHLAVIAPVIDITPPVCEAVSVNAACSGNCSLSSWYLTANVTDGNGSGIQIVRVLQGNGDLSTTTVLNDTGVNVTMVVYNSSCCSSDLELVAVDAVGNVATCFTSTIQPTSQTSTNSAECCLFSSLFFWLNVGVSLYQLMEL